MEDQSSIHLAAEENRPLTSFQKCLPCPCNAGSCRLFTSTKTFAGRQFYRCPAPAPEQCKFFKWADSVEPHELINVPYCGGCMSGVCRFRKVESGPNAGRILFVCTIKEGQGSCGFKIWQDELEITMGVAHQSISLSQSTFINCNDTGPAKSNVVADCELSHKELDNESPLCDPLQYIQCLGTTSGTGTASGKMEQLKCQEDKPDESSWTPLKKLNGIMNGASPPLNPKFVAQEEIIVNSGPSTIITKSVLVNENYSQSPSNPRGAVELLGTKPVIVALDAPSCDEDLCETKLGNFLTETISKTFVQAAEHLKEDFLTRLEAMDFKDHEAMTKAAQTTFAALDRLFYDHQPLKERVEELIRRAISLTEIKQSMPNHDSYQKLVDRCHSERMKLDEIDSAHAKAVNTVDTSRKHLKLLQEELSSTKNRLFQVEAQLSHCKVEMRNMEHQLEQISMNKEILKENFVIASKEWEDSSKLHEQREAERSAAKEALDRARVLLRR